MTYLWTLLWVLIERGCKLGGRKAKVRLPEGIETFLYCKIFRPKLRPAQLSIQWISGQFSLWVKYPGPEADHFLTSASEVKDGGNVITLPHASSWQGNSYIKHSDTFALPSLDMRNAHWNKLHYVINALNDGLWGWNVLPPNKGMWLDDEEQLHKQGTLTAFA
jgi:hypothetical protein